MTIFLAHVFGISDKFYGPDVPSLITCATSSVTALKDMQHTDLSCYRGLILSLCITGIVTEWALLDLN